MKVFFACVLFITLLTGSTNSYPPAPILEESNFKPVENVFIITIDGLRWQEIFAGADPKLLENDEFTRDGTTMRLLYDAPTLNERRQKLLPFFWNVISQTGQLHGNRSFENEVNVANLYSLSYPGYNEMLTGTTDLRIMTNNKRYNPNKNVLEFLNQQPSFNGKVVAFTSWNVFPYILNDRRNGLPINSGYSTSNNCTTNTLLKSVEDNCIYQFSDTRHDELTYIVAKEYIQKFKPNIVFIGFGETDVAAHEGRYDNYLEKISEADRMINKLWHFVQTTESYKNNTTFLITTDHGRGAKHATWTNHGWLTAGSSHTWLALLGPNIEPLGEIRKSGTLYQKQIAHAVAQIVGQKFKPE